MTAAKTPRTRPSRARPAHLLHVDGFALPGPAGGALVVITCIGCRLHGRIISDPASAQELTGIVVDAHQTFARERLTDG